MTRKLLREAKKKRIKFAVVGANGKQVWATEEQVLLWGHLKELLGIECLYEFKFCEDRRFSFDLYAAEFRVGFECDGHFQGKHGTGWGTGHEKINLAQAMGFRCFQFSNREVSTGKAKEWLENNLFGIIQPKAPATLYHALKETGKL